MPDVPEAALFAIMRALKTRQAGDHAARIAAETILATLERHGWRMVYDPTHELPPAGLAPKR